MLKKYRNSLLTQIQGLNLDSSEFSKIEKKVDGFEAFIIKYESSQLYFMIRLNPNNHEDFDCRYVRFSPEYSLSDYYPEMVNENPFSSIENDVYITRWASFEEITEIFHRWLNYDVKEYIEEIKMPDLWQHIDRKNLLNPDPLDNINNSKFTNNEKKEVKESIEIFRNLLVNEYSPTNEQLNTIDEKLTYLIDSTERLGKTDWQGVAISTILSISVALTIDTTRGNHLFSLFKQAFSVVIEYFK